MPPTPGEHKLLNRFRAELRACRFPEEEDACHRRWQTERPRINPRLVLGSADVAVESMHRGSDVPLFASSERSDAHHAQLEVLPEALKNLMDRERAVVTGFHGLNGCESTRANELGRSLGVTSARISQIKAEAFAKMKPLFEAALDDSPTPLPPEQRGTVLTGSLFSAYWRVSPSPTS
ncbi:sigma factor-like helix-turn-helix DNA-binding protein [Alienimonas sp. DA493]|uniref:sigma factor-like helix-turn-helix DNA-binding protein n=1 Tax=Alienimonas sp. DA493 TaxID=3373605 RepID=UPI003754DBF4